MIRLRATLTGAKWRFVSKANAERAVISAALVTAAPRRKARRLIAVLIAAQITQIYSSPQCG
jgi:hypothetical protein